MHKIKTEECTLKDFTLSALRTEMRDRAHQFTKWLTQIRENDHDIYWLKSNTGVKASMQLDLIAGETISFIANDYLGMSQREETKEAAKKGIEKYGCGVCASPTIGGYLDIHEQLEKEIAGLTGLEDALIFSSGFGANVGVLNALLGKDDIAFTDFQIHKSAADGLFNTNRKQVGHNDIKYLNFILEKERSKYKTSILIIDGVYSQDGDIAPLAEIVDICKKHNTLIFLDDAHGIGVLGNTGRGTAEYHDVLGKIDFVSGTFSKAFGSVGGFVASSKEMCDYLRYYANTTVFSAAIAPPVTCSVLKAIELLKTDKTILKKLWDNVNYLRKRLLEEGYDIGKSETPIFPILIRDTFKVKEITRMLLKKNIYAIGLTYPAVANKDSRIRISVLASHTKEQLDTFIAALNEIDKEVEIRKT
jgi:glycine C-acetyltransferase